LGSVGFEFFVGDVTIWVGLGFFGWRHQASMVDTFLK